MKILFIGCGGFVGALLRYAITHFTKLSTNHHFPIATLIANGLGCLMAGMLLTYLKTRTHLSPELVAGLSVGFLGALTTFSAFSVETLHLMENYHFFWPLFNIVSNIVLGFCALYLGRYLMGLVLV